MRKLAFLAAFSMLALFVLTPAAFAQDQYEEPAEIFEELVEDPQEPMTENVVEGEVEAALEEQVEAQQGRELTPRQEGAIEEQIEVQQPAAIQQPAWDVATITETTVMGETTQPLPKSGGPAIGSPSILLPAAALLLGAGVLGFAVLRRR
jgi:hypothetical protein